jgi:hypothetical protein
MRFATSSVRVCCALACVATVLIPVGVQAAGPTFRVASPTVQLGAGRPGILTIEVTDPPSGTPAVKENNAPAPLLSYAYDPLLSTTAGNVATCVFIVSASATLDRVQPRTVVLTIGTVTSEALSFSAQPSSASGPITIGPPITPITITDTARAIELPVTTTPDAGANVQLVRSTLVDSRPGKNVPPLSIDHLHLCSTKPSEASDSSGAKTLSQDCSRPVHVPSGVSTIWLKVDDGFRESGVFTGIVQVGAVGAAPTTLSLTIQQSSDQQRALGVLLIAAGVTIAWLVLSFGRGRVLRDQALLPAILLRQRASTLDLDLSRFDPLIQMATPRTRAAIAKVASELSDGFLDAQGFLPPDIPSIAGNTTQTGAYQMHLQNMSNLLDGLETIVSVGIQPAASKLPQISSAVDRQALASLVGSIDALADTLPVPSATLVPSIETLLDQFHTAVSAQSAGRRGLMVTPGQERARTGIQVVAEMRAFTGLFWVAWVLISTIVGYMTLIATDPGYGGTLDALKSLLFGFGLPMAGQAFQQLSLGTVATQFGVTR